MDKQLSNNHGTINYGGGGERQGRQRVPQLTNRSHRTQLINGFVTREGGKPQQAEIGTWVVEGEAGQWEKATDPLTGADLPGMTMGLFGSLEDQISQPFEMGYREGVEVGYMAAMGGCHRDRHRPWPFERDDSAEIIVRDRVRYSAIRTRLIEFFNLIACKDMKHRGIYKGSDLLFQLHNHSYRIKIKTLNI